MQKPNLDNVKKFFEKEGYKVGVDYKGDHIRFSADKNGEMFRADLAFRKEDMEHAEKIYKDNSDIANYINAWGEKLNYNGTAEAVRLYEKEFGASSVADVQTVSGKNDAELNKNKAKVNAKSVAAVEQAFKQAGYMCTLSPSDKGTAIETWNITFILPSPMSTMVAGHGYSEDWARQIGEANIAAAKAQNMSLKLQDNWFYYGSEDAIKLFESLGGGAIEVLYQATKVEKDAGVANVEAAFKSVGYSVTITPMGEITMLSCMMSSPFSMLTAMLCASADDAKTNGAMYGASAAAMNLELKYKDKWFYYGHAAAVKVFEDVIK